MSRATFDQFIDRVLGHEGGYVNHPHDPGGATNFGVTQRTLDRVRTASPLRMLPANVRNLTRDQAKSVYYVAYWTPISGNELPPAFGFQLLDAYINHSPETVVRWAQRAAGAAEDGIFGPMTMAAIKRANPADLVLRFLSYRLRYYTDLSTWPTFGKGWTRRLAANLLLASDDN